MRLEWPLFVCAVFGIVSLSSAQDLRQAVQNGDVEGVKSSLEAGAKANQTYENGFTPIFFANKVEVVELLLSHGAKLDIRDRALCQSPIERAADRSFWDAEHRQDWKAVVERLRKAGAEYTVDTAIYMDDVNFVRDKLGKDASWVNDRNAAQSVPLKVAARTGRVEICKLLLEHNADPDAFKDGVGFPIMLYAKEHPEIIKLLIKHGANLRRRITWKGSRTGVWIVGDEASILHYAVSGGNLESVKLLVEAGVDPNAADVEGQTPLHIAVRFERWNQEYRMSTGTPEKITSSFALIIKYLVENDASLHFTNKKGETPLRLAERLESPDSIVRLLEAKGNGDE